MISRRFLVSGLIAATLSPFAAHAQVSQQALTVAEVGTIISQAVAESQARSLAATISVVDRVGNVLAVFQMTGAAGTLRVT